MRRTPPIQDNRTIVIKADGRSYANLLKTMKRTVTVEEAREVLYLRRGARKELYMQVKDAQKTEKLKTLLRIKAVDLQMDIKTREDCKTVVHIKDIEAEMTELEIQHVIAQVIGEMAILRYCPYVRPIKIQQM